jgi:hypothetical protein
MTEEALSFEDGVLLCKYIYQCAIQKTLNGVPEQWDIFYRTHQLLKKLQSSDRRDRLFEVLYQLNLEDVYQQL